MNRILTGVLLLPILTLVRPAMADPVESVPPGLAALIEEALARNPEIRAAAEQVRSAGARVTQAGALDDPELTYMREQMPGFRWNEAMMQKVELMQMIPFPTKLFRRTDLASVQQQRARRLYREKVNEVISRLKSAYAELWFAQRSIALNRENAMLLKQFADAATTKYTVGTAAQQDVLKAFVEIAKLENELAGFRQKERSATAMVQAILYRSGRDTLSPAVLPEEVSFPFTLDSLEAIALRQRPMLLHDSLMVHEARTMVSLAKQEYLPDLRFGIGYVSEPMGSFRGWNVSAGVSLPFAPWTLGKASARVEESEATLSAATASYHATRTMVRSELRDLFYRVESWMSQLKNYRLLILPQAEQSLHASMVAYQTGNVDFLSLIDSYRTLVELQQEALMLRMQFEQGVADLERTAGLSHASVIRDDQEIQE